MLYRIYSVFDVQAQAYAAPFFLQRDEIAVRAFRDAVMNPEHPMSKHPEDYRLYRLGTFNDADGFLQDEVPLFIVNGTGEPTDGD